jgi:hypothetical protein
MPPAGWHFICLRQGYQNPLPDGIHGAFTVFYFHRRWQRYLKAIGFNLEGLPALCLQPAGVTDGRDRQVNVGQ